MKNMRRMGMPRMRCTMRLHSPQGIGKVQRKDPLWTGFCSLAKQRPSAPTRGHGENPPALGRSSLRESKESVGRAAADVNPADPTNTGVAVIITLDSRF